MMDSCREWGLSPLDDVKGLFNRLESAEDNPRLSISNLNIEDYDVVASELAILEEQHPTVFTKERVLEEYTSMRYYTSIDKRNRFYC